MILALLLALAASPEELDLLASSLRPEGLAELTANVGPLAQEPLSEVEAELDPEAARLEGKLRLVYRNREAAPLGQVVLRLYPQASRGTSLKADDVRVDGVKVRARAHGSVLEVPVSLAPGATAVLTLAFHGKLRRLRSGDDDPLAAAAGMLAQLAPTLSAGRGSDHGYGTFAVGEQGAVLVDWYPQLAARARGQWDRLEPGPLGDAGHADPSSAVVALTVPKGWRVSGAGAALGQHASAQGKETASFAAAGIRGALGMSASPFFTAGEDDAGAVHLRASSLHGEAGAQALLDCARAALKNLEPRFGPYPWKSLAIAEAPLTGGAGGVELPGFALIAQALSPRARDQGVPAGMFEFTCFHEVAHQWWQGVVGSDPRRAPWVDEALAQWSAVYATELARGGGADGRAAAAEAEANFVSLNYQGMRLAQVKDAAVARPADQFRSPLAYAGLVYGKAPLFFTHARALMGDQRFGAALREYRRRWAFREAGGDAFLEAAQWADPAHARELADLEKRWWHERHGDEDLGQPDALALLQSLGGAGSAGAGIPGLSQLMRMLQQGGAPSDAQLRDAFRAIEKLMPDLARELDAAPRDDAEQGDEPPQE